MRRIPRRNEENQKRREVITNYLSLIIWELLKATYTTIAQNCIRSHRLRFFVVVVVAVLKFINKNNY